MTPPSHEQIQASEGSLNSLQIEFAITEVGHQYCGNQNEWYRNKISRKAGITKDIDQGHNRNDGRPYRQRKYREFCVAL